MRKIEVIKQFLMLMVLVLLLTIFAGNLILGFVWIAYLLPIDFPGTAGDWITTFASLIAGALTLVGVWITIKKQEQIRKEDISIQYEPKFVTKVYGTKKLSTLYDFYDQIVILNNHIFLNDFTKDSLFFQMVIENIGRGEALDFSCTEIFFLTKDRRELQVNLNTDIIDSTSVFPKGKCIQVSFNLYLPEKWKNAIINHTYNLCVKFSYSDIMHLKRSIIFQIGSTINRLGPVSNQYRFQEDVLISYKYCLDTLF